MALLRRLMEAAVLLGAMTGGAATGQVTGGISGRVVGSGAGVVPNAKVYLHSKRTTFRLETAANPGGVYRFDNVPVGDYEVCATPVGGGYVDSCIWNRMGNPVQVTAAAKSASADITLQRAAKLQLQVSDGQFLLEQEAGKGRALQVHIWTDGFVSLPVFASATSRAARTYEVNVPVDVDVAVGIQGPRVRLSVDGVTAAAGEKNVHRMRVDGAKESVKTVPVTVLGLAP